MGGLFCETLDELAPGWDACMIQERGSLRPSDKPGGHVIFTCTEASSKAPALLVNAGLADQIDASTLVANEFIVGVQLRGSKPTWLISLHLPGEHHGAEQEGATKAGQQ